MPEITFFTVYLIVGLGCAIANWADDFNHGRPTAGWGECLMIVLVGPIAAVADLGIKLLEMVRGKRK